MIYAIIPQGFGRWKCIGYEKWEVKPSREYDLGLDRFGTWCSCPASRECKHMGMMRDRRRKPGLWYNPDLDAWSKENLI